VQSDLIADPATQEIIQNEFEKTRKEVADILSSVHSGTFLNNSGRPDGDELENQITNKTKDLFNTLSKNITESLPKTNRVVQMVESGSKGSGLNITQMVGLLGQQLVEGRRIKYTLQDRTLPHFPRFDDGFESRGFVENSFITGLRPAEFFFHAMGGREGLIDTAVKTSDSGYIQRKLVKSMEDLHVEYDGTVRNVNGTIVQFHYGGDGIDTTAIEKQPCWLGEMSMEDIYRDFGCSQTDFEGITKEPVGPNPPDLVEQILQDRDVLVRNVFQFVKNSTVEAPVHMKRLVEKYRNPYATKTDLTPEYVVEELSKITNEPLMKHNTVFHILLRFYLAPKKSIINLRLSKDMFDELLRDVRFRYIKAQVQPGEMVGTLAAQSIGEPTTQLTLNTFHSAGTVKANATAGVPRIKELIDATHNPKNPLNVVYMDSSISGSQEHVISKMKEIQKTTLRDITKAVRIYYDPNPLSSDTLVQEDRDILLSYEKFSVTQGNLCVSPWILRLELDTNEMAARNIIDMSIIQMKIENNRVLHLFECVHSDTNTPGKMVLRITFSPEVVKNALSLRFIEEKLLDTVLTGVEGMGKAYVREIKNEMLYDEKTGGYAKTKQYVLDVEGANLLDLALVSNTDPYRNLSNDIHEILDVFGIEAVRIALYRELSEAFSSEKINYHHLITLIDNMTNAGFIISVNRSGMSKNESGVLTKSSFEETSKVLFNAAISADFDNMRGVSANIMFGQKPPCGTGFVDILIDETKLPEGTEEDLTTFGADLAAANQHVAQEELREDAQGECRMEDIVMEW
jgi:DNA-directed RNA polymerase II subunit RPB1